MSKHLEVKHKLKNISSLSEFLELINSVTLTDDDKHILKAHYLQGKSFGYIADQLGFSESTVKKKHHNSLCKLNNMMDD